MNLARWPGGSDGKELACNAGDLASIPGLGRSPGEGKGYPLQYSSLENSTDCMVHGIAKSWTRLSHFQIRKYRYIQRCRYKQGRHGNLLQYSCLENPMDSGAWWAPWGQKESDMTEAT